MRSRIKNYLPKSLLGRSLMIIVTPLILLQIVSATIFYETHWDKVTLRLARSVAGDIAAVIYLMRYEPVIEVQGRIFDLAAETMQLAVSYRDKAVLNNSPNINDDLMTRMLSQALKARCWQNPFYIDADSRDRHGDDRHPTAERCLACGDPAEAAVQFDHICFCHLDDRNVAYSVCGGDNFYAQPGETHSPPRRCGREFRQGTDVSTFKPEGAAEVRQAASAFMAMRERDHVRQIRQRTDMLAGVSHDLRTPLTRMRLQVEMLGQVSGADDLKSDIAEMEHMLEGYLSFCPW